jgi:co-chaperonin GroES (HSP10)
MKVQATNNCIWVIRDEAESQKGGLIIPDIAKKKTHQGKIQSVGKLVQDKSIKTDNTAIFNQTSGFEIDFNGITYTILRDTDVIGVI